MKEKSNFCRNYPSCIEYPLLKPQTHTAIRKVKNENKQQIQLDRRMKKQITIKELYKQSGFVPDQINPVNYCQNV